MKKILIIEDMEGIRDSISVVLEIAGYDVDHAANGKEGLSKLKGSTYQLVITDILMPDVDGTEVVMQASKQSGLKIIAMSGGGNGVSATQALDISQLKADAIFEKPFSSQDLLQKVKELLDEHI